MKNLLFVFFALVIISCGNQATQEASEPEMVPVEERTIGFATNFPDLKWHLGTEEAIQIVREIDEIWSARNYDGIRPYLADTAKFYFADGREAKTADEFIEMLKSRDNPNDSWTFNGAYSVDLNPEIGGEHVQAGFTGYEIVEGDTTTTYYHESYYIIQGKLITWNQYTQTKVKE